MPWAGCLLTPGHGERLSGLVRGPVCAISRQMKRGVSGLDVLKILGSRDGTEKKQVFSGGAAKLLGGYCVDVCVANY